MELKDKIKDLREEKGWSLKTLGDKIGLSDTAILKWEQGETEPKASNLKALAMVFNISIDDLLEVAPAFNKDRANLEYFLNNMNNKQKQLLYATQELTNKEIDYILNYVKTMQQDKVLRKLINEE